MRRADLRSHVTLYAVQGGTRYHRSDFCEGLNAHAAAYGNGRPVPTVTRRQVVARGLTPCKVCLPPPMLTVVDDPLEGT